MEQQPLLPEELLNIDGIIKISTFLTYAPRFKEDIFLVMDHQSPADVPPSFLPASIATLLARLCDLLDGVVDVLWSLLKGIVWSWEEKVQIVDERYDVSALWS